MVKNIQKLVCADTGQGKTYNMCLKAIYLTMTTKKLSIIAVPTKALVDEIATEAFKIKANEIKKKRVLNINALKIYKHTFDERLTSSEILDSFKGGDCLIITVFPYIKRFDSFNTVGSLNPILYMLAPIVNLFIDEADQLLNNIRERYDIVNSFVDLGDHKEIPSRKTFYCNWDFEKTNEELLEIRQFPNKKTSTAEKVDIIKPNYNTTLNSNEYIKYPKTQEEFKSGFIISEKGMCELDTLISKINFKPLPYIDSNQKSFELDIPEELSKKTYIKTYNNMIYNSMSFLIREVGSAMSTTALSGWREEAAKIANETGESNYEDLFEKIFQNVFNIHIKGEISHDEDVMQKLEKHFCKNWEIYKKVSYETNALFSTNTHSSANKAFFYKLLSSSTVYVNYFFPQITQVGATIHYESEKDKRFSIKISEINKISCPGEESFIESAKNLKQYPQIISAINKKLFKNSKSVESDDESESNSETATLQVEKPISDKAVVKENNQITNYGLKESFSKKIVKEISSMGIKPKTNVYKNLTIKIKGPNHLFPFGSDVYLISDHFLQILFNCNNCILLSATYKREIMNKYINQNEFYKKFLPYSLNLQKVTPKTNPPKIDLTWLILSKNNYFVEGTKKNFYESFWKNFVEQFYKSFVENKNLDKKRFGFIVLPSNKKVNFFYNYLNFNDYITKIIANEETSNLNCVGETLHIKKFSSNSLFQIRTGLQMFSIFSSPAVGINVPHVFYLNVSINNYHPSHVEFEQAHKVNGNFISAEYEIIANSLKQIQGRLTRKVNGCKKNIKVIEMRNIPPKEGMCFFTFYILLLKKISKNIQVIHLNEYEEFIFIILKGIKINKIIQTYNLIFKFEFEEDLSLKNLGIYFSNFKINLIKIIKNEDDLTIVEKAFIHHSLKYLENVFYFLNKIIIALFYETIIIKKQNKKKIKSWSQIKQSLSIFKNEYFIKIFESYRKIYDNIVAEEVFDLLTIKNIFEDHIESLEIKDLIKDINTEVHFKNQTFKYFYSD